MSRNDSPPPVQKSDAQPASWTLEGGPGTFHLALAGGWFSQKMALPVLIDTDLKAIPTGSTLSCIDSGLTGWDTGLIAFLWDVRSLCLTLGLTFDDTALSAPMRQLLNLLPAEESNQVHTPAARSSLLEKTGQVTIDALTEIGTSSSLAWETLRSALRTLTGRSGLRPGDLLSDLTAAGPSALVIVGVVNFLIGAVLAFVGAVQLQKFAAGIYVASLVGIASVREMAAVMTAIIMAGRTGGAYAARISTMQGNEEIDALRVFGIPVSSYLILPAVLSLIITMPILYLYGCLIGMLGGYVVAISMLDITSLAYFHQTIHAFGAGQFLFGLTKSLIFGAFIGLTSCRIGLKAGRSAADVGIAATRAVVIGIVGVIALDALFAVLANSIGV